MSVTVAAIQFKASNNKQKNLTQIKRLILKATKKQAKLIVFPEVSTGRCSKEDIPSFAETLKGPSFQALAPLAQSLKICIVIGIIEEDQNHIYNTLLVIDQHGELNAAYRKIHLFTFPPAHIDEKLSFSAGKNPIIVELMNLKIALCICYDLRFPWLFQHFRNKHVDIILAPSAFTAQTGEKDWDLLIRTRALDTQSYLVAPNQYGEDVRNNSCYGHSAIVGPDGSLLKQAYKAEDTVLTQCIDREHLNCIRKTLPTNYH